VDDDGREEACLIRTFASPAVRDEREREFYGSEDWRSGPRDAIVSSVECYHTVMLNTSAEAVSCLRSRRLESGSLT
jgi:hypothetical protein